MHHWNLLKYVIFPEVDSTFTTLIKMKQGSLKTSHKICFWVKSEQPLCWPIKLALLFVKLAVVLTRFNHYFDAHDKKKDKPSVRPSDINKELQWLVPDTRSKLFWRDEWVYRWVLPWGGEHGLDEAPPHYQSKWHSSQTGNLR